MKILTALLLLTSVAARAEVAKAHIKGTAPDSQIEGWATLEDAKEGLKITAQISGLTPGQHGFHIHEWGDCSDAGKAAGAHYNPRGISHGDVLKHGVKKAHVGDMGNLTADEKGMATIQALIKDVKLGEGKYRVAGRSLVVHEKADDFSQPAGNAGGRVACGLIGLSAGPAKN